MEEELYIEDGYILPIDLADEEPINTFKYVGCLTAVSENGVISILNGDNPIQRDDNEYTERLIQAKILLVHTYDNTSDSDTTSSDWYIARSADVSDIKAEQLADISYFKLTLQEEIGDSFKSHLYSSFGGVSLKDNLLADTTDVRTVTEERTVSGLFNNKSLWIGFQHLDVNGNITANPSDSVVFTISAPFDFTVVQTGEYDDLASFINIQQPVLINSSDYKSIANIT